MFQVAAEGTSTNAEQEALEPSVESGSGQPEPAAITSTEQPDVVSDMLCDPTTATVTPDVASQHQVAAKSTSGPTGNEQEALEPSVDSGSSHGGKTPLRRISVCEISPLPSATKQGTGKRMCKRSEVITSSPMKVILEEKNQKKLTAAAKKSAAATKKLQLQGEKVKCLEEKSRKRQKTDEAKSAKRTAKRQPKRNGKHTEESGSEIWICENCKFTYGEPSDPKISEDWCPCSGCRRKYHISCAEDNGLIDDDELFTCKLCV